MSASRRWLRERVRLGSRGARLRARRWLRRHPRVRRLLWRTGSLEVDDRTLARGVGLGLFVGLTPTVGVQTLLMLGAAMVLRANFPAAFVTSWINNPLTMAPLYLAFHALGVQVMEVLPIRFDSLSGLEEQLAEQTTALVIGSLCVAVPAALAGYAGFLMVWRRLHLHLPPPLDDGIEGRDR